MAGLVIDADGHVMEQHQDLFSHIKGNFGEMNWHATWPMFDADGWQRGLSRKGKREDPDAEAWVRSLLPPLELQVRDQRLQLRRRTESVMRVRDAQASLGDQIAQLEATLEDLRAKSDQLKGLTVRIREASHFVEAEPDDRLDLIVATNVLVYYDVFEQSLALTNIASMLRPGGVLLTNNPLFLLPSIPLTQVGYTDVAYSTQASSRDRVFWYRRD